MRGGVDGGGGERGLMKERGTLFGRILERRLVGGSSEVWRFFVLRKEVECSM